MHLRTLLDEDLSLLALNSIFALIQNRDLAEARFFIKHLDSASIVFESSAGGPLPRPLLGDSGIIHGLYGLSNGDPGP